jgi:F420-dependent oxidoreductase-like protein
VQLGVFISEVTADRTGVGDLLANAWRAEELGFATGWAPHIPWSLDGLAALTLAATVTDTLELGTAVMPTYTRHPLAMAQQALSAQAASGGRLVLGIGPSHPVVIETMFGMEYTAPAQHTREYVEVLRAAFACTGHVAHEGEHFRVNAMLDVPGASPAPILIAALAPLMLRVAGWVADGTITYWANERAVAEHIVPRITRAAEQAGRATPRVIVGIPIALVDDVDAGREDAAALFDAYNSISTYQRIIARGGEDVTPREIAIVGTGRDVIARLRAYADAGATDIAAAPVGLGGDPAATRRRTLEFLGSLHGQL